MDCLIHRASQGNDIPKAVYKSLKCTMDSLLKQFHADICVREIEAKASPRESNPNMEVDTAVEDPRLAIPSLDDQLEEVRVVRERATATLPGDFDAAEYFAEQLSTLKMM